jgi:HAD superfamily hydrolase (TIGR01484 family)
MQQEHSVKNMQPLALWPAQARRQISGVLTDIDDTLTTHGAITPDALQALFDLKAAGLTVIAITGRPIGWCQAFMAGDAPWPVDAMVAENGALAWIKKDSLLSKIYQQDAATRATNQQRMQAVAKQIVSTVAGAHISRDSAGRETDLAIDHAEYAQLSETAVAQVLTIMQAHGMQTTVSSIHIHGCFGNFNKCQGAQWIVRHLFQQDLALELARWVFVGDSGNDESLFEHFRHSVGVANIRDVKKPLAHWPQFVTLGERGAGFAQVAQALLQARAN